MRIVSLLPSATEIVCALGHGHELVGRSADCDFPREARALPVVMRPREWNPDAPSGQIDARVRSFRSRGESLYELDLDLLRELSPDLLLTQDLCGVCSVTEAEVQAACERTGVHPEVVSLAPMDLDSVWDSVELVGRAVRDVRAGARLADALRRKTRPPGATGGPRVAVVEWLDPPILAGLWVPDIVRAAGGSYIGPIPRAPGARTTWDALRDVSADLLVLSPCSFSVSRTLRELEDPTIASSVRRLSPVRGTFVADEAFFSRPGPRLAGGVDLVRRLLSSADGGPPKDVQRWVDPATGAVA
jgi:iron complex transport system substrate-binding protein